MKITLLFVLLAVVLSSCISYTRKEKELFTITEHDTIRHYYVPKSDIEIDGGVIHPSTRTLETKRYIVQRDSLVVREYPDFIRLGLFESVGIIGGKTSNKVGTGLFGLFPDFIDLNKRKTNNKDKIFTGGIYRIGIFEDRLRWFEDSPNWTYGSHAVEFIIPDSRGERLLYSFAPFYLRKRYFLKEDIPYITLTFAGGVGLFPSQYVNLTASLDFGSIGGVNFRTYAGLAIGYNSSNSPQIADNDFTDKAQSIVFPYLGLGISLFDFHNKPAELYKEWKDHEHSSWEIGLIQLSLLQSTTNDNNNSSKYLSGLNVKLINSNIALPYFNYKAYIGTSLFSYIRLNSNEHGFGVLPIRFGYWQTLVKNELILEPYIEYSFYPSKIFTLASKLNLVITDKMSVGLIAGYTNVSTDLSLIKLEGKSNFSGVFIGVHAGLERIFFNRELRYFR